MFRNSRGTTSTSNATLCRSRGRKSGGSSAIGLICATSKPRPWYQFSQYRRYLGSSPVAPPFERSIGVPKTDHDTANAASSASDSQRRVVSRAPAHAIPFRIAPLRRSSSRHAVQVSTKPIHHHRRSTIAYDATVNQRLTDGMRFSSGSALTANQHSGAMYAVSAHEKSGG